MKTWEFTLFDGLRVRIKFLFRRYQQFGLMTLISASLVRRKILGRETLFNPLLQRRGHPKSRNGREKGEGDCDRFEKARTDRVRSGSSETMAKISMFHQPNVPTIRCNLFSHSNSSYHNSDHLNV
jgi:hypothetical protein